MSDLPIVRRLVARAQVVNRVAARYLSAAKAPPADLAEAKKMGEAAFKKGVKAPALDGEFRTFMKEKGDGKIGPHNTSLLEAWNQGWTKANLADTDWMKEAASKAWVVYLSDKKDPIRDDSKAVMSIGGGKTLFALPANTSVEDDDKFERKVIWKGKAEYGDDAVQIARKKM
jgi:hypothetical protein